MQYLEQKIIQLFARDPTMERSTTMIVRHLFPDDYATISRQLRSEDKEVVRIAKRSKARLHRKLLYYLNKLEREDILFLNRVEGRGEKFFSLNPDKELANGKDDKVRTIIESVSTNEGSDITSDRFGLVPYEQAGIIKRFDEKNWTSKLNAILLNCNLNPSSSKLYDILLNIYPVFNDVTGLHGFERVIAENTLEELAGFLRKANEDTVDYGKYLSLLIDLRMIADPIKLGDFLDIFAELNPTNMYVTFLADMKTVDSHHRLIRQIVNTFAPKKIRINIQNTDLKQAPLIPGRGGMYGIDDSGWSEFLTHYSEDIIGLCFGESSLYIDINRFFKEYDSTSEFRTFVLKAGKMLVSGTASKRRMSDSLFSRLNELNKPFQSKFFIYSRNYIRLWNYRLLSDEEEFATLVNLFQSCKQVLSELSSSEETIFKSCGIPTHINLSLSSTFKRFDKNSLSPRKYTKFTIKSESDFHTTQFKQFLKRREQILRIFSNIDRVRFFRSSTYTSEEVINEFIYILRTTRLPFFAYDFRARKGELTLDDFFG
ncbi:MAG: hypothetical protein ACOCZV_01855 [Nanoarchaeota archaeon]